MFRISAGRPSVRKQRAEPEDPDATTSIHLSVVGVSISSGSLVLGSAGVLSAVPFTTPALRTAAVGDFRRNGSLMGDPEGTLRVGRTCT